MLLPQLMVGTQRDCVFFLLPFNRKSIASITAFWGRGRLSSESFACFCFVCLQVRLLVNMVLVDAYALLAHPFDYQN